jgi:uncharacterized protein YggT (Ycf19 family)
MILLSRFVILLETIWLFLNAFSQRFIVINFIFAFVDHHSHRQWYHSLFQLINVALDLLDFLLQDIHAVSMQQNTADIHLSGHHLGFDHLAFFQVVLFQ